MLLILSSASNNKRKTEKNIYKHKLWESPLCTKIGALLYKEYDLN